MAGDVEHVERQDHRPADALQLEREAQREPQIGRVGDTDEEARGFLAGEPAQHDVAGDDLVEAAGAQRICAGQIDAVCTVRPAGVTASPSLRSTVTPG